MAVSHASLFQRVVAASGLAEVIAAPAIRRAVVRAGVDPESMTSRDLEKALPAIEACLHVYLPPARVQTQIEALRRLPHTTPVAPRDA
jgi:hypothetical protein